MDDKTGSDRNSGHIALTVLVVLAIVASLIMLFADNDAALKLALLAALWAAVIGFFLVYRYRAQAKEALAQAELREEIHAKELEQARTNEATNDVLAELKEEIAGLRAQLEDLSGQPIGYEPSAIRADARRILEVGSPSERLPGEIRVVKDTEPVAKGETGTTRATPSVSTPPRRTAADTDPTDPADPVAPAGSEHPELRVVDDAAPEKQGRGIPNRASAAQEEDTAGGRESGGPAAPRRRAPGAPSADAVAGRLGQRPTGPNPLSALISENARREGSAPVAPPKNARPSAQQNPAVTSNAAPEPEPGSARQAAPTAPQEGKKQPARGDTQPPHKDSAATAEPATQTPAPSAGAATSDKAAETRVQPAVGVSRRAGAPELEQPVQQPPRTPEDTQEQPQRPAQPEAPSRAEKPEPAPQPETAAAEPAGRRGRRRRDENAQGISVAELLKNLEDRR